MKKDLIFDKEARQKLLSGIKKISDAVGSTMGPFGNTVIIQDQNTTRGVKTTKDGVTVAKSIQLVDPVEDMAVTILKEAAERTAKQAGDGTTASIVLAHALVAKGMAMIDENPQLNITQLLRDTQKRVNEICDQLKEQAVEVSDENLEQVATISVNNDPDLGRIIADAFREVGRDGVVAYERGKSDETYYEATHGVQVDRGYTSPLFMTNRETGECVLEDVYILIANQTINSLADLDGILEPIIKGKKGLLIVGELDQNTINALGANVIRHKMKFCHIMPPNFGWKSEVMMNDLAAATGGKCFSDKTGDDLSLITIDDLGYAKKIIVTKEKTAIFADVDVTEYVDNIKAQKNEDKAFIKQRVSKLAGGVAIVYAGGHSDAEQKELYDRIEDGVRAVESALEMGILPGGGVALMNKSFEGNELLKEPLHAPYCQIFLNAHQEILQPKIYNKKFETHGEDGGSLVQGFGKDLKTGKTGNMIEMGIIDPTKVVINTLQNAFSVASQILSTNTVITFHNEGSK